MISFLEWRHAKKNQSYLGLLLEEQAGFRILFAKNSPQESQTSSLHGLQISHVQWALNEENSVLLVVISALSSSRRLTVGF